MSEADDESFSLADAMAAQGALRQALHLPPERFPLPALVGMLGDEIDALRAAGHPDDAIAALIEAATGRAMAADAIARFHVSGDARRRPVA